MLLRITITAWGMLLAGQAIAGTPTPPPHETCSQSVPAIRESWLKGAYEAPPEVATLMVDAIDGKLPEARRQLQAMDPADAARWRQSAMLVATWAGRSAVVDGLLDDGAAVDDTARVPSFKPSFLAQTVATMKHDPRFGGPAAVDRMTGDVVLTNRARTIGPALTVAARCSDLATLDVLLRHHARVNARNAANAADALTIATVGGAAPVVQRLLDHGADPCADDRRFARHHLAHADRPAPTLARIGTRARLPAALVARLTCPTTAATH